MKNKGRRMNSLGCPLGFALGTSLGIHRQSFILFYMNKIPPFLLLLLLLLFTFFPFFASIRNAYRILNNGQTLTFKVSKQLYRSSQHDRSIYK